jgi:hypothetical protein
MRKKMPIVLIAVVVIGVLGLIAYYNLHTGRTASRLGGKEQRQVLSVENMDSFVSISFSKKDGSTVKDVTFMAADGYYYTKEFKDVSPLEGVIRWVPHDEDGSSVRTRAISRWTGKAVHMELPDDFDRMLGVDVDSENGSKNMTYRSTDGNIYSKEYRDGWIDRKFQGWIEVKSK